MRAAGRPSYDGGVSDIGVPEDLARLRSSIDNIDAALVHLLAERFKCTQAVGELKARIGSTHVEVTVPAAEAERARSVLAAVGTPVGNSSIRASAPAARR